MSGRAGSVLSPAFFLVEDVRGRRVPGARGLPDPEIPGKSQ
jgi:hypothetical protein